MSEPTPEEEHIMTDQLDRLLATSAPEPPVLARHDAAAMITDARGAAAPRRRRYRPVLLAGVVAAVLTGGAGVAVASDLIDWAPWAEDPVGAYSYRLPSGTTCEVRFGNVTIVDRRDDDRRDQIEQELRDWFGEGEVLATALDEVDDYIAESRDEKQTMTLDDGTTLPGGFGTPYYDADREYSSAISQAIDDQVSAEAERRGFADEIASYEAHGYCPEGGQ